MAEQIGGSGEVAILLGGNEGNVEQVFSRASELIAKRCRILRSSRIYASEAWGMDSAAPEFRNQVLILDDVLGASELLRFLLEVEQHFGRQRPIRSKGYQNRPIDIDILYYGEQIVNSSSLQIPHPRLPERKFALVPLQEVAPHWRHPHLGITTTQLLQETPDSLKVWPL